MTSTELLIWARGTGLQISIVILIIGVMLRLLEMLMLGRPQDFSAARVSDSYKYGWRTVFRRFLPGEYQTSTPVVFLAGYVFHTSKHTWTLSQ